MISIDPELLQRIRAHAERDYPNECCGALLGKFDDNAKHVREVFPIGNRRGADAARKRFLITADDYRAAESHAADAAMDVIGFYHSHPDHPARPSDYDRDHALPWYSYVIVAVAEDHAGELTSWVLDNDRATFSQEAVA